MNLWDIMRAMQSINGDNSKKNSHEIEVKRVVPRPTYGIKSQHSDRISELFEKMSFDEMLEASMLLKRNSKGFSVIFSSRVSPKVKELISIIMGCAMDTRIKIINELDREIVKKNETLHPATPKLMKLLKKMLNEDD